MTEKCPNHDLGEPLPPPDLPPLETAAQASEDQLVEHYIVRNKIPEKKAALLRRHARDLILRGYEIEITGDGSRLMAAEYSSDPRVEDKFHQLWQESPTPVERWKPSDEEVRKSHLVAGSALVTEFAKMNGLSQQQTENLWKEAERHVSRAKWLGTSDDKKVLYVLDEKDDIEFCLIDCRPEAGELRGSVFTVELPEDKPRRGITLHPPEKFSPANPGTLGDAESLTTSVNTIPGTYRVTLEIPEIKDTPHEVDLNGEVYYQHKPQDLDIQFTYFDDGRPPEVRIEGKTYVRRGEAYDCEGLSAADCAEKIRQETRDSYLNDLPFKEAEGDSYRYESRFDNPQPQTPEEIGREIGAGILAMLSAEYRKRDPQGGAGK